MKISSLDSSATTARFNVKVLALLLLLRYFVVEGVEILASLLD
jgi:hypothetical protein